MKIKWALDNKGDLVVTDGKLFVGFAYTKHPSEGEWESSLNEFTPYVDASIKILGVDKITDWQEYDTEASDQS